MMLCKTTTIYIYNKNIVIVYMFERADSVVEREEKETEV